MRAILVMLVKLLVILLVQPATLSRHWWRERCGFGRGRGRGLRGRSRSNSHNRRRR